MTDEPTSGVEAVRREPLLKDGDLIERLTQFRMRWQEGGDLTYLGKALLDAVAALATPPAKPSPPHRQRWRARGMGKLTNSFRHVLQALMRNPDRWTPGTQLPNGHGYCSDLRNASGVTLRAMRDQGLIEYGRDPQHSHNGYRITDAGRAALARAQETRS